MHSKCVFTLFGNVEIWQHIATIRAITMKSGPLTFLFSKIQTRVWDFIYIVWCGQLVWIISLNPPPPPPIFISLNSIGTKTDKPIDQFLKKWHDVYQWFKFCIFFVQFIKVIFVQFYLMAQKSVCFFFLAVTWCKNEELASISHFQWSLHTAVTLLFC